MTKKSGLMKYRRSPMLFVIVAVILSACHWNRMVLHRSLPVDENGWSREDTLVFSPDSLTAGTYRLSVEVRYTDRYPYQDLWLMIGHNILDTSQFVADTLACHLINQQGHFLGDGTNGLFQMQVPFKVLHVSTMRREPLLKVHHCMEDKALKGISDVGLRLERVE